MWWRPILLKHTAVKSQTFHLAFLRGEKQTNIEFCNTHIAAFKVCSNHIWFQKKLFNKRTSFPQWSQTQPFANRIEAIIVDNEDLR